ncbi:PAS domain-containing protein [Isoptericola variabilis]|uniref:PAS domain-containing protein n=1 Tax=Isoptericola variabilis TaxID=139208 RepID=UPI0002FB44B4|nr:PAS domain-containing protein [Isoptericola variabilis]TWH34158.1 PAS domain-containing protein [Isoptericola variabilis J7]
MDQVHARTFHAPPSPSPSPSPARPVPGQQPPRARADALARETPTGRFRVDLASGTWWWSDETFRIHGFEPGEVVPTRGLVLTHKHPEDRTRAQAAIAHAERSETPFSCLHRIFDADGEEHLVVVVGRGHRARQAGSRPSRATSGT